jgi:hypothetical protein
MTQNELDNYWKVFNNEVKSAIVPVQRRVSLQFCELVKDLLDSEGLRALHIIREMIYGKVTERRRNIWQKKMTVKISRKKPSPYSVLAWALESDNPSYPPYYAAGIAGLNIVDLKIASLSELRALAREVVFSNR